MHKLYNYFKKLDKENKIVQSYLIGNTKYDIIAEELDKVLNDFIFDKNSNSNIDIQVLKAENGCISKDSIKEIIEYVSKTSQFNGNKVYIIDECELLNDYSYNAILKTLEEPQPNVYAFLITKNIDSVKETISSRCQKIFLYNTIEKIANEEYIDVANELYNILEDNSLDILQKKYNLYSKIQDRNELLEILNCLINIYDKKINEMKEEKEIKRNIKKMLIIDDIISMLDYNLNKNLCIDRIMIEIWRCNNENGWN